MTHIEYFLKGYLRLKLTGENAERFLNLCGNHGILVWAVERYGGDEYHLNIPLEKKREIAPLLGKTNTEAVLLSEHGLPFLLRLCRRHVSFLAGMLLCFLLWGISGQYLWNIVCEGNNQITRNQLERYLLQKDIEIPMLLHRVDTERLGEQIRQDFPIVTWVSVSLHGTTMSIHIKENELKDYHQQAQEAGYQDLIAAEDGVIVSMITRSGTPVKNVGDHVVRGDVLVEGSYPVYAEDGTVKKLNYCKADADIVIAFAQKFVLHEKIMEQEKKYTGKEVSFKWISVGGKELSPYGFLNPEKSQEIVKLYESGSMLLKQKFPIQYGTYIVRPYEIVSRQNSDMEMQRKTDEAITDLVKRIEQKGVQIRQKNVTIKKNEKRWDVEVELLVWCSAIWK